MEEELADDFEYLSSLCFMGLLGKGTANLPTSVAYSESDESGTEINSSGIAYTLNSNGTIEKETVYGRQFTYSYQTEGEGSELAREYFSIEGATYLSGDFPQSTTNAEIQGLTLNSQALSGGFNFVTIVSETTYRKFFVGVKGVSGYYEYEAMSESGGSDYNSYMIPISYSEDYDEDITMLISAEDADGGVTKASEEEIKHVSSESGDLNVNLTFSNAKDIDLHLYMPDGEHIYYSHRGGTVTTSDGSSVTYGLDHDSNAACNIDNLNNENIYIPAELIQSGTYTVKVDMYSNCDRTTATSWSVVARYKGDLVVADGDNPVSGVYPVGAGSGDMTTVMTFTISAGGTRSSALRQKSAFRLTHFQPSDIDLMKLEELSFREEED
ncbi:MAG: hypothetical protein LUC86_05740 [Prevotellaceae bacterium]|nr:hypothetical protein [Prevotellaceae bacterium]